MAANKIKIINLAQPVYKKCECCNRVKDILFKMSILDAKTGTMLVGDFDLCQNCGENISDVLNLDIKKEVTVKGFSFEGL
jgi:hypothetical protein